MNQPVWFMVLLTLPLPMVLVLLYAPFWLWCRLTAQRCDNCGSKWCTELNGEWDGEYGHCHVCGYWWIVK